MELGGYVGRILRLDLTSGEAEIEEVDEKRAYNYLGGRGYAADILYRELDSGIDAYSSDNKLVFMTGPLTGTIFPGAGRISISSKSPLTGTIFDCSMGGSFGTYLKRGGFDGVVVEGRSKKPVYLLIDDGEVKIKDASELWGKETSEVEEELKDLYDKSRVVTIGPAGENQVDIACLISETRAAGRGGLGGVMGSKRLKAIVVRGNQKVEVAHRRAYDNLIEKIRRTVETHPITGSNGSLSRFGTSLLVHRINSADMLPKDNFSDEDLDFEDVDPLSGETVREEYLVGQKACFGCPTGCGRVVETKEGRTKGPEFESVAMLGPNSGFYDYEGVILPLSKLCDELGLDTISVGNIIGFARSVGSVSSSEEAEELIEDIASGESIFSEGVGKATEVSGEEGAVEVKGLELPAYDPRGAKGIALAYATSNRGGCHLRAYTISPELLSNPEFVNPSTESDKAELVRKMQDAYAVYDSIIACKFHGFALFTTLDFELDEIAEILSAVTGLNWTGEELHEVGSRIYNLERLFNFREGFTSEDDTLPERFDIELSDMLDDYYEERGWDDRGTPEGEVSLREPEEIEGVKVSETPFECIEFPQVQVALDMDADIETICDIAERAYRGGSRIIEAGTPAIKRHGTDSLIPALREVAPDALIVADLKTMDVGGLEARIAFRPGADVSAVLAAGGKNKIIESVSEAVRHGRAILIDFIGCPDPIKELDELVEELEGNEDRVIFCFHRGISEQLKGRGIYEKEELLAEARKRAGDFKLAVAGGIKKGVAKNVANAGAEICVVGSAVYNSSDPEETTKELLKEVRENYGSK